MWRRASLAMPPGGGAGGVGHNGANRARFGAIALV